MPSILDRDIGEYLKSIPHNQPKVVIIPLIFHDKELLVLRKKDAEKSPFDFELLACDIVPQQHKFFKSTPTVGTVLKHLQHHSLSVSPRAFFVGPDAVFEDVKPFPLDRAESAVHPTIMIRIDIVDVAQWAPKDFRDIAIFGNFLPEQHDLCMATKGDILDPNSSCPKASIVALNGFDRAPSDEEIDAHFAKVAAAQSAKKEEERRKRKLFRAQLEERKAQAKTLLRKPPVTAPETEPAPEEPPAENTTLEQQAPACLTSMNLAAHDGQVPSVFGEMSATPATLNMGQRLLERGSKRGSKRNGRGRGVKLDLSARGDVVRQARPFQGWHEAGAAWDGDWRKQ